MERALTAHKNQSPMFRIVGLEKATKRLTEYVIQALFCMIMRVLNRKDEQLV